MPGRLRLQQMIDTASLRIPAMRRALPLGFLHPKQPGSWGGIGAELLRLFGEVGEDHGEDVGKLIDLSTAAKLLGQIARGFGPYQPRHPMPFLCLCMCLSDVPL